ncbi:MAG: hypothetical protein PHC85_00410 [Candidatus Pacebacteria bacterium]|nr:hypothetical protein [Candidatus Paceibacterota bacterium]
MDDISKQGPEMVYPEANKPDRKKKILIISAIIVGIIILSVLGYLAWKKWGVQPVIEPMTLTERQAKELDDLRAAAGGKELTQEELMAQSNELEQARADKEDGSFSGEDINKQAAEIDALREKYK